MSGNLSLIAACTPMPMGAGPPNWTLHMLPSTESTWTRKQYINTTIDIENGDTQHLTYWEACQKGVMSKAGTPRSTWARKYNLQYQNKEVGHTCTVAPYEAIAGRSISRWASTDATSDAVETESTCCTPFSFSPNAPCAQYGSQVRPVTAAHLTKEDDAQVYGVCPPLYMRHTIGQLLQS